MVTPSRIIALNRISSGQISVKKKKRANNLPTRLCLMPNVHHYSTDPKSVPANSRKRQIKKVDAKWLSHIFRFLKLYFASQPSKFDFWIKIPIQNPLVCRLKGFTRVRYPQLALTILRRVEIPFSMKSDELSGRVCVFDTAKAVTAYTAVSLGTRLNPTSLYTLSKTAGETLFYLTGGTCIIVIITRNLLLHVLHVHRCVILLNHVFYVRV